MREARVASTLTHPNVAVVYDVGEDEQGGERSAYVAMEYVKGQTLSERLKQGRMDAAEILKVAEQVAEALADAHEHGIVHRDVKPGNVMLGERALVSLDRRMRSGVEDPMSPHYGACAHALRGESVLALDCLERAAAKRRRLTAARAAIEPAPESLRDEPRFRAIVGPARPLS